MWWLNEPWRMIQTNLREIDADLNPRQLVADVKDIGANVLLFNVGGIVANYPTELEFHYRNPNLQNDLVGEVLAECKKQQVRFLGRFDFSKANRQFFEDHPEWFYRGLDGSHVDYNGQVHTCVNGAYQREYSLKILKEALDRYAMDGVFFNMFGYQTRDYSGNYHGICQCDNCRKAFQDFAGADLPREENRDDPLLRTYRRFQRKTVNEMLDRIADLVKSYGEDVAVCTYATHRVDIVRSESNSAVDRPLPHWVYSGSDNTRFVTGSWSDKIPSNSSVHFVDIPYRYVGVSPHLTALRLAQTIANGGGPDYYVIGTLDRQWDRTAEESIRSWFHFSLERTDLYQDRRPAANVALLAFNRYSREYQGLYTLLAEEHVLFHNLDPNAVIGREEVLDTYDAVVIAGPVELDEAWAKRLDGYVARGGKLIVTQEVEGEDASDGDRMPIEALGVDEIRYRRKSMRSAYLKMEPSEIFGQTGLDLCFIDGPYRYLRTAQTAKGMMPLIPPHMYGPPEKCYYTQETDNPGLISHDYGEGKAAYFPWNIGELYYRHRWPGHRLIFSQVLHSLLEVSRPLETDAPEALEAVLLTKAGEWMNPNGHWLLQFVNTSGNQGPGFYQPYCVEGVACSLKVPKKPSAVETLDKEAIPFEFEGDRVLFTLPEVELLSGAVIRW